MFYGGRCMKKVEKLLPFLVGIIIFGVALYYCYRSCSASYDYMLKYKDILDLGTDPTIAGISTLF